MNWIQITAENFKNIPENTPVMTKIDDEKGARNEQSLIRQGNLWWMTDMSMYVYYSPTHYAA